MLRLLAMLAALAALAPPAFATGEILRIITPADTARLEAYAATRAAVIAEARAGGDAESLRILDDALGGTPLAFTGFDAAGPWKCRVIKVGGLVALTVYPWFACRISDDGSGYRLEKTTGSQRTSGRFFTESETRWIYLGALHIAGDPPKAYASDAMSDQAAYAIRPAANRLRLEFPAPRYESKLDILVLERK